LAAHLQFLQTHKAKQRNSKRATKPTHKDRKMNGKLMTKKARTGNKGYMQ
jgi:hypothetical protein